MRIKLLALGIVAAAHFTATAQEHRLGVGVMMGEPTGPVGRYFLNSRVRRAVLVLICSCQMD
jgi:hypothetical protein